MASINVPNFAKAIGDHGAGYGRSRYKHNHARADGTRAKSRGPYPSHLRVNNLKVRARTHPIKEF